MLNTIQRYHLEHKEAYQQAIAKRKKFLSKIHAYSQAVADARKALANREYWTYLSLQEQIADMENKADQKFDRLRLLMLSSITANVLLQEYREYLDRNSEAVPALSQQLNSYALNYSHADPNLHKKLIDLATAMPFNKFKVLQYHEL